MAASRYLPDRGLTARMGLTMFLLGLLYVALIAVVTSYVGLGLGLVLGGGALFAQWFFSDRIALWKQKGIAAGIARDKIVEFDLEHATTSARELLRERMEAFQPSANAAGHHVHVVAV